MATIQIKTPSPDQAIPLVKDALAMETKLTHDSLRTTEDRITALAQQLDVTPEQVPAGTVRRREDNEALLLDLEGELELRRVLQDTLRHLEQLEVCP
jgi:outer membrane PBP1 activator LpoA protein